MTRVAYVVIWSKKGGFGGDFDPGICQCTINQLNQWMNQSSHLDKDYETLGGSFMYRAIRISQKILAFGLSWGSRGSNRGSKRVKTCPSPYKSQYKCYFQGTARMRDW